MRIMGLDFGGTSCGVAISDELHITAQGIETIFRKHANKLRQTYARIEELCAQYDVGTIVVGLPKKLDNSEGERAQASREFAADVERRTGLKVVLWDERFSTVSANRVLQEANVSLERKKEVIDKLAAVIILQNYLDSLEIAASKEN